MPLAALAAAAAITLSSEECAVWNREASFAASVAAHDASAFAAHLHSGAVFNAASASPVRGKSAVLDSWAEIIEGKTITLSWRPHYVSIGGDPNIAISRGPYAFSTRDKDGAAQYRIGEFSSVWVRKNARAPWLVLFDGNPAPPRAVATEAQMQAHLGAAPQTCVSAQ